MDGLWSIAFSARQGVGYGVVIFQGENLFGGDSSFYWTGTFKSQGGRLEAAIRARSHSGHPVPSVLGTSSADFSLQLEAAIPTTAEVGASFVASGAGIQAKLIRRS